MENDITMENAKKYIFDDLNNWCDRRFKEATDKKIALNKQNRAGEIAEDTYYREVAGLNGETRVLCSLKMHLGSSEDLFRKTLTKAKVFDDVRTAIENEVSQALLKDEPISESLVRIYAIVAGELPKENQS